MQAQTLKTFKENYQFHLIWIFMPVFSHWTWILCHLEWHKIQVQCEKTGSERSWSGDKVWVSWSVFPRFNQLIESCRLRSPSASIAIDTLSMLFFNRPPHPSLTHPHHRRHHCILILPRLSRRSLTFRMRCSFFKTSRGEAWLKSNLWYPLKMCVCWAAVWVGCLGPPIVKEPKVLRVLEREIRESHTHTTHTLLHTHPHNMAVSRRPLGEFSGKAWWE